MKATTKTLAILLMAAAGFTACGDDDNNVDAGLKEYALDIKVNLIPNDSTVEAQLDQAIEAALTSMGLPTSQPDDLTSTQPYLYITARDSADAAPKIQEMGKKLEAVLDRNASHMYGDVSIMAIEKQQLEAIDNKQSSWSLWYEINYPAAENYSRDNAWSRAAHYFVYKLEICNRSSRWDIWMNPLPGDGMFNKEDKNGVCYRHREEYDMNYCAGGSYLYLVMYGVSKATHPTYGKKLITDVVMLNTGHDGNYPKSVNITKDGVSRCYYPVFTDDKGANGSTKHDLNNGTGGPYLWMYYTTDYRDGWVLANKIEPIYSPNYESGLFYIGTLNEHEYNYYMRGYKQNAAGEWEDYGTASTNDGTDGFGISFMLCFWKAK